MYVVFDVCIFGGFDVFVKILLVVLVFLVGLYFVVV